MPVMIQTIGWHKVEHFAVLDQSVPKNWPLMKKVWWHKYEENMTRALNDVRQAFERMLTAFQ